MKILVIIQWVLIVANLSMALFGWYLTRRAVRNYKNSIEYIEKLQDMSKKHQKLIEEHEKIMQLKD